MLIKILCSSGLKSPQRLSKMSAYHYKVTFALLSGRSRMPHTLCLVHDFFEPQAIKEPAAFVLRFVIHDWADGPSIKILKNLRAAAKPDTRLVIFDSLMPHVCTVLGALRLHPRHSLGISARVWEGFSRCPTYTCGKFPLSNHSGSNASPCRCSRSPVGKSAHSRNSCP